jgi:hypothetical protein
MQVHVFSSRAPTLPPGWTDHTVISVVSSGKIDASVQPRPGAKLSIFSFLSSTTVIVPKGCQVQMSGGDVLGSQSVDVESSADGPLIEIRAIPVLSSVKVRST